MLFVLYDVRQLRFDPRNIHCCFSDLWITKDWG